MALVKCKDCGGEMSRAAKACPKCGAPPPSDFSIRRVMVGVGVALVALPVLAIIGGGRGTHASPRESGVVAETQAAVAQGQGKPVPLPETQAPVQEIPAVELITLLGEYRDNELRADGRFKDRIVRVTGKVDDVKKDIVGDPYVTIGTGAMFEIPALQCMLSAASADTASHLRKGAKVTVTGTNR